MNSSAERPLRDSEFQIEGALLLKAVADDGMEMPSWLQTVTV